MGAGVMMSAVQPRRPCSSSRVGGRDKRKAGCSHGVQGQQRRQQRQKERGRTCGGCTTALGAVQHTAAAGSTVEGATVP